MLFYRHLRLQVTLSRYHYKACTYFAVRINHVSLLSKGY
jgi:hypothetical protein